MKLEDFISESLTQIISGVIKSQVYAENNNALVNPDNLHRVKSAGDSYFESPTLKPAQVIEFDISVSTRDDEQVTAQTGVFVSVFKLGIEGKEGTQNLTSNRLRFSVPLMLPTQKAIQEDKKEFN